MENKYSESELLQFMDYLGDKGIIKLATAKSRKIAASKILGALDENEKTDLRNLDRERAFMRFQNKSGKDFTPDSLLTYKSRFFSALDDFLSWVENPATFKPAGSQRAARGSAEQTSLPRKTSKLQKAVPQSQGNLHTGQHEGGQQPLIFPIPIRDGVVVKIHNLPIDLTRGESERICAVIRALAVVETA